MCSDLLTLLSLVTVVGLLQTSSRQIFLWMNEVVSSYVTSASVADWSTPKPRRAALAVLLIWRSVQTWTVAIAQKVLQ